MEYIDFTKKKIELHKEVENAIKNMMTEKGVTEIDLTQDEENYDAGWVIRSVENASELEEVQVAYIKLYGNSLFYKGELRRIKHPEKHKSQNHNQKVVRQKEHCGKITGYFVYYDFWIVFFVVFKFYFVGNVNRQQYDAQSRHRLIKPVAGHKKQEKDESLKSAQKACAAVFFIS